MKKLEIAINGTIRNKEADTGSLTVGKGSSFDQIHIGYMKGKGADYRKVDEPQVSIWIGGEPVFEGSFEELKKILTKVN